SLGGVVRCEERLGTPDEFLLRRDVRPAPPFVELFRLSQPSQELVPQLGHALRPRRPLLRGWERPEIDESGLRQLELAPRGLRVERFGARQVVQPGAERVEARHVLALRFAAASVGLLLSPRELLAGAREPPPQCDGTRGLGTRPGDRSPAFLESLPHLLGGDGEGRGQRLGLDDHRLELSLERLARDPLLAARRRLLAAQLEAPCQGCGLFVGDGFDAVPCGNRVVEGTRCGGVIEPFDALAESGTRREVLLHGTPTRLGFVLTARQAPRLVEDRIAGLLESLRDVFPGLDLARDTCPFQLDSTHLLGRPEENAPADQPLDRQTELELPCASFLHAHREPLDGARGQERPGSLAYA